MAADISHINTHSTVKGYDPTPSGLRECLEGSEVILIPAGVPRKPGMTRDGKKRLETVERAVPKVAQISSTPTPALSEILQRLRLMLLLMLMFWLSLTLYDVIPTDHTIFTADILLGQLDRSYRG